MLNFIRTISFTQTSEASLVIYFLLFLTLLKFRSVELKKTWFVPLFALYFGLMFATLFGIFLNGVQSGLTYSDHTLEKQLLGAINPFLGIGGKVMYGGYFGLIIGILVVNFVTRRRSLSTFLDISAISTSLLFSIWRIGCFSSGCCYGCPNDTFGVMFTRKSAAFEDLAGTDLVVGDATVPLLPTQLISSFGDFAIFLFLLILFCRNKTRYPYFYFFAQALLYGIGRFTIEFFRIDPREFWGVLSMSQWLSLLLIAGSLVFFIKNRKEIADSFRQGNAEKPC